MWKIITIHIYYIRYFFSKLTWISFPNVALSDCYHVQPNTIHTMLLLFTNCFLIHILFIMNYLIDAVLELYFNYFAIRKEIDDEAKDMMI